MSDEVQETSREFEANMQVECQATLKNTRI